MPDTLKEGLAQPEGHMTAVNWKMLKREGEGQVSACSPLLQHLIFTEEKKGVGVVVVKICVTLKRG